MSRRKSILVNCGILLLPVLSALIVFVAGEIGFRLYQRQAAGIPFRSSLGQDEWNPAWPLVLDDTLGWRARAGFQDLREVTETTSKGVKYPIKRSQKEYGFRMFGDLRSTRPKVLVIGDSFTQALQVSDDDTYYASLKDALGVEVFAYGAGGYGTLQEYMILDQYVDMIKPTLILWQFCANDFINNDPALETASLVNNNGWRRPYWVDGHIVYVLPKAWSASFRIFAQRHSRFLHFLLSRWDRLLAIYPVQTVEVQIEREGLAHQGFQHAVQVTSELMGKVRSRVGGIPIVAFSSSGGEPYDSAFKAISFPNDVVFLQDIAEAVEAAHKRGDDVFHADMGHWSVGGHRLIGSRIGEHLRAMIPSVSQIQSRDTEEMAPPIALAGPQPVNRLVGIGMKESSAYLRAHD
jgi:hypothetical protein